MKKIILKRIKTMILGYCDSFPFKIEKMKGTDIPMIKHPLLQTIVPAILDPKTKKIILVTNENAPKIYERLKKQVSNAKNLDEILILYIHPAYYMQVIYLIRNLLGKKLTAKYVGKYWSMVEFPHIDEWLIKAMLKEIRNYKKSLMTEKDFEVWRNLPANVKIYRGIDLGMKHRVKGLCWSLNRNIAIWFAKRFAKKGMLVEAEIPKGDIFFYNNSRNEEEVVVNSYGLRNVEKIRLEMINDGTVKK